MEQMTNLRKQPLTWLGEETCLHEVVMGPSRCL